MSFTWFADKPLRTREQVAREVHAVSLARGLDELATVICLMAVSTEVGADDEDGNRQWWCPINRKDPTSVPYEHDSESNDGYSSGYLQQQLSGPGITPAWGWGGLWGDREGGRKRMTLATAADMFLAALPDDYTRAAGNPALAGEFAQHVQGSKFPDRYQGKWDEAWTVLRRALADQSPTTPEVPAVGWTGDPTWLEDVLRPALGDRLRTLPGWQTRGHGDFKDIRGVMWHHTGNSNESAESIARGRPDLAGPLANIHIAPNGIVTIVALGVCWHAGEGSYPWLPTNNANWHMIGVECAWPTPRPDLPKGYDPAERWPDAQIISMRDTAAALSLKLGVGADHNIGHKDYAGSAQGKWDPGNLDTKWFQGEIAKDMRGEFDRVVTDPPPVVIPADPPILPQPLTGWSDRALWEEILKQQRGPELVGWKQLGGKTVVDYLAEVGGKLDKLIAAGDAR